VARSLDRFEGDEDGFRRFAFTIARRRLLDHRRRRFRRRTDPVPAEDLADLAGGDDPAASALGRQALAVVGQLPGEWADVVLLRVVAGLDAAEVGRIIGKSAGAVRVIQHRALRRLAEIVADDVDHRDL
jgi:RNA polymerase sigma-70 factor, ECF subfamily